MLVVYDIFDIWTKCIPFSLTSYIHNTLNCLVNFITGHHQVLGDLSGDPGCLHGRFTQPLLVLPKTSPRKSRVH